MIKPLPPCLLVLCALAAVGCDCGKASDPLGELALATQADGVIITTRDGRYDFGIVSMGTSSRLEVVARNIGRGPLELDAVTVEPGAPVRVGDDASVTAPVFEFPFQRATLEPGAELAFTTTFDAPLDSDPAVDSTAHHASLLLRASHAVVGGELVRLALEGVAVRDGCALPKVIDFGAVALNRTFSRTLTLANHTSTPAEGTLGPIVSFSGDGAAFAFSGWPLAGPVHLSPGVSLDVPFTFRPTAVQTFEAQVTVRLADWCPETTVRLVGTGVDREVSCSPAPLDFGAVLPGLTASRTLTLENASLEPVGVEAAVAQPSAFSVLNPAGLSLPAATVSLAPDGSRVLTPGRATVQVGFAPAQLGALEGTVVANTDRAWQPSVECAVSGFGGGPRLAVSPAPLDFGRIAFFPSSPSARSRSVVLRNVGNAPATDASLGTLHLGNGTTYWTVTARNAWSPLSDLCVGHYDEQSGSCASTADGYTATKGLEPGEQLAVPVRVQPSAANLSMEWDVTFFSDDPLQPATTVTVKAQSVSLPACQYSVSAQALDFGMLTPATRRDLSFTLRNLGTNAQERCLVEAVELADGSHPAFTLPAGPAGQRELGPGESLQVTVRGWPQGPTPGTPTPATGAVTLTVSSPSQRTARVGLSAFVGAACLIVSPGSADFGTVKVGCGSERRAFSVYNVCGTPAIVDGFGLAAGTTSEFQPDGPPSFAVGSALNPNNSMPATFALTYRPVDVGADTGVYRLAVKQLGQTVDYLVDLRGRGSVDGLHTETFVIEGHPKADVLLVIDNSCSMMDDQNRLQASAAPLLEYAKAAQVDYHVGVTTTDTEGNDVGSLVQGASGVKVVTPSTPNAQQVLQAMMMVGLQGGREAVAEPAIRALTAPLVNTRNAGFSRLDASLAVVGITDAVDQTTRPVWLSEAILRSLVADRSTDSFSYSVLGPFGAANSQPPGCSYDGGREGPEHLWLVGHLGGLAKDICAVPWDASLRELGQLAFGGAKRFFLTVQPDPTSSSPMTVWLDGQLLPPVVLGRPTWTWDAVSNRIVFSAGFEPTAGQVVTVTFPTACH